MLQESYTARIKRQWERSRAKHSVVFEIVYYGNESFHMSDVVVDVGLSIQRPITVHPIKTRPK